MAKFKNPWSKGGEFWNSDLLFSKALDNSSLFKTQRDDEQPITKEYLKKKYGVSTVRVWFGYFNDSREENVKQIIEEVASFNNIIPSYLATIAVGEGLGLWIDSNYDSNPPNNVMVNNEIDGFIYLGVDNFGGAFDRLKKYLPQNFDEGDEFYITPNVNEMGQTVQSAVFKNLKSGIYALSAVVANRRETFIKDSESLNYSNYTEDELYFWIYVYFQGVGRAFDYLKENNGFDFSKPSPQNMRVVRNLSLERLASWRYTQSKSIFTI